MIRISIGIGRWDAPPPHQLPVHCTSSSLAFEAFPRLFPPFFPCCTCIADGNSTCTTTKKIESCKSRLQKDGMFRAVHRVPSNLLGSRIKDAQTKQRASQLKTTIDTSHILRERSSRITWKMTTYTSTISTSGASPSMPEDAASKPHHVVKNGQVVKFKNPYPSYGNGIEFSVMWSHLLW